MADESIDIFLSHAGPDKLLLASPLAIHLSEHGISYWLDENEMRWGDNINDVITEALSSARFIVVFLTPNFIGKPWPEAELRYGLQREIKERRTIVLPIISGDEQKLVEKYSFLKERAYSIWENISPAKIARDCYRLLNGAEDTPPLEMPIAYSEHGLMFRPEALLELLESLSHRILYYAEPLCVELRKCGLRALADKNDGGITVNGLFVIRDEPGEFGWGEGGIDPYRLAYDLFQLFTGGRTPTSTRFAGRGPNYRALIAEFRNVIEEKISQTGRITEDSTQREDSLFDIVELVECWSLLKDSGSQPILRPQGCYSDTNVLESLAMVSLTILPELDHSVDILRLLKMAIFKNFVQMNAAAISEEIERQSGGEVSSEKIVEYALNKAFSVTPYRKFKGLWQETTACRSQESRLLHALEKLVTLVDHFCKRGRDWIACKMTMEQAMEEYREIERGSPELWEFAQKLLKRCYDNGWLE